MKGHVKAPTGGGSGVDLTTETNFGTAASGEITLGHLSDDTSVSVKSGTGGIALASTGTGTMTLSSGGALSIDTLGTDAINLGTQAAAKTITIGNDASTKVDVNAIAIELDSAGAMTLSSGGALSIDTLGTDAINLGTQAAAKTITIGNDASTKVDVNAIAIELDSAGDMTLSSGGTLNIDTVGSNTINLGIETAPKTISIGNKTGATTLALDSGSGGITLHSNGGPIFFEPTSVGVFFTELPSSNPGEHETLGYGQLYTGEGGQLFVTLEE